MCNMINLLLGCFIAISRAAKTTVVPRIGRIVVSYGLIAGFATSALAEISRSSDIRVKETRGTGRDVVRIVSWDLHDLWHEPGVALRPGAVVRSVDDFVTLRAKARSLKADIVALQGIGSPRAARKLFPSRNYFVVFSRELAVRLQRDRDMLTNPARRRVYNAIAIRRAAKLRVLAKEQILETADPSPKLGSSRPQGQSALAVKLRVNKKPVWVVTSRLIDGCNDGAHQASDLSPQCTALRDQMLVLNAWKSLKATKQEAVVTAIALPSTKAQIGSANWRVLTHSNPVKVAIAYRAQRRATRRLHGGAVRRFVLTNPVAGPTPSVSATRALQPNTVELTGPSRPGGRRLFTRPADAQPSSGNLVIDALSDFARSARKSAAAKPEAPKPQHLQRGQGEGETVGVPLSVRSIAALLKMRPTRNADTDEASLRSKGNSKPFFVRYPRTSTAQGCDNLQSGANYLLVDRMLHERAGGAKFDTTLKARGTGDAHDGAEAQPGTRTDCAIVLELPR